MPVNATRRNGDVFAAENLTLFEKRSKVFLYDNGKVATALIVNLTQNLATRHIIFAV